MAAFQQTWSFKGKPVQETGVQIGYLPELETKLKNPAQQILFLYEIF